MKKVRSDAAWTELSPEQLETLDGWLFEEKLGFTETLPRAQKELGYKGQLTSLKRYFLRRKQELRVTNFESLRKDAEEITGEPTDPKALRAAALKVLEGHFFEVVKESPDGVKEWGPLAKLLLADDRNKVFGEENEIRREVVEFAKERFHFDIMEKALVALPQLRELAEARKDPLMKRYEENARLNRLRRLMFGAGQEVQPESAQEEAEMLAARKAREGATALESGQITEPAPPGPSSQYHQEYMEAHGGKGKMTNDE